jgi:hypothetical protein
MPSDTVIGGHQELQAEASDPTTSAVRLHEMLQNGLYGHLIAENPNAPPEMILRLSTVYPLEVLRNPTLAMIAVEDPSTYARILQGVRMAKARFSVQEYVQKNWWRDLDILTTKGELAALPKDAELACYTNKKYSQSVKLSFGLKDNEMLIWLCGSDRKHAFPIGKVINGKVYLNEQGKRFIREAKARK